MSDKTLWGQYVVLEKERDALRVQLEATEADALEQARLNGMGSEREAALLSKLEMAERERDALRVKIEVMERQEPVGKAGAMPGTSGFTMACFRADAVPFGSKLYALPGAKGEEK